MKVGEWMQKDPVTVGLDTSVTDVARLMVRHRTAHIVVVDTAGGVAGIITAADLIAKHAQIHMPTYFSLLGYSFPLETRRDEREIERALAVTARDLMTTDVITVDPLDDVDVAATRMLEDHVSCLPVIKAGKLAGIVDEFDVVRLLVVEEDS